MYEFDIELAEQFAYQANLLALNGANDKVIDELCGLSYQANETDFYAINDDLRKTVRGI